MHAILVPRRRLAPLFGIAAYLVSTTSAAALDLVEVIKMMEKSVVRIDVKGQSIGSGVIVDDRGLVLTSFHVVEDGKHIEVTLQSGKRFRAQGFFGADMKYDLALLKTDKFPAGSAVTLAEQLPQIGEKVAAFGTPQGFSFTTTEGVVSAIRDGKSIVEAIGSDKFAALDYTIDATWIQSSTGITNGNSGGPLVDMSARLVGINTWISLKAANLGFSIAVNDIKTFLNKYPDPSAVQKFADLPKRIKSTITPSTPGRRPEFKLALPSGRVFNSDIFLKSDLSGFNHSVGTKPDDIVSIKHPNGVIYAMTGQQHGLLHGSTIASWENGKPKVYATYVEGKRHGILMTWDEAGNAVLYGQYNQGKKHGFFCYFENNDFRLLTEHKNDQLQWIQLMSDEVALEGFPNRAKADKVAFARDLLDAQDKFEATLKVNEIAFRKQIKDFESAKRRAIAAALTPEKCKREHAQAMQRAAEQEAFDGEFVRRALGGR